MSLKTLLSSIALMATLSNPIHAAEPTTLENKVAVTKPTKAQLEEAVKNNPYCGKPGYECKAEGWAVPDVEKSKIIKEKIVEFDNDKQKVMRAYATSDGVKFTTNSVQDNTYLIHVKGNPDYAYLDGNCDKIYEIKLPVGAPLSIPVCVYK